jgi:ATP-dependent helicase HepA
MAVDPRIDWIVGQARGWRDAGDKTLVFVAHRETLEALQSAMSQRRQLRVGLFHEDLSPGQRDIEVAQFRLPGGPSMLVSTECGGEGRNFEFCTRLVLFDLPWSPMLVEQRIGRLDRIGRRLPVEIVYFRPPSGIGAAVVELYESLGLFSRPLGGLERELAGVEAAIEELALSATPFDGPAHFRAIVSETRAGWARIERAAYHELHREPYREALAEAILARIPAALEEQTRDVVLAACERLNLHVEAHRGGTRHSIEFQSGARVESLPGVPAGARYLGTFDREQAVQDESIDFFATGHPLVEGVLAHLEESPRGRVALLHASGGGQEGLGLLALFRSGAGYDAVAVDAAGRERPEWAERLTRRPLRSRRVVPSSWTERPEWPRLIRGLARHLEGRGAPVALAAFRIG